MPQSCKVLIVRYACKLLIQLKSISSVAPGNYHALTMKVMLVNSGEGTKQRNETRCIIKIFFQRDYTSKLINNSILEASMLVEARLASAYFKT